MAGASYDIGASAHEMLHVHSTHVSSSSYDTHVSSSSYDTHVSLTHEMQARSCALTSAEAHTRPCTRVPATHVSLECLGVQHAADERVRLEAMERLLLHPDPEGGAGGRAGGGGGGSNQAPVRDQEPNGG
jgi:hypothetical protein